MWLYFEVLTEPGALPSEFRALSVTHPICVFKDLKDWASSEVVSWHQPTWVDCYGCGALHQDHWLCTSGTDFPGSSKKKDSSISIWNCIISMSQMWNRLRRLEIPSHLTWMVLFLLFFRRLMDKHYFCWTSQRCKSAWTWSWDQPSSCATISRGSSWHFTSSLPHSWEWMWTSRHQICYKSCERRCNCPFWLFLHWIFYRIPHMSYGKHGYFLSLGGGGYTGSKTIQVLLSEAD